MNTTDNNTNALRHGTVISARGGSATYITVQNFILRINRAYGFFGTLEVAGQPEDVVATLFDIAVECVVKLANCSEETAVHILNSVVGRHIADTIVDTYEGGDEAEVVEAAIERNIVGECRTGGKVYRSRIERCVRTYGQG